jgi:isocitrate/isopropylmalate dehydrogenase
LRARARGRERTPACGAPCTERASRHPFASSARALLRAQHETIETAIERGQKLDTLIEKSNELSGSSKMFLKTAKKQNQCCRLM